MIFQSSLTLQRKLHQYGRSFISQNIPPEICYIYRQNIPPIKNFIQIIATETENGRVTE
jgi:hypothetical protein